MEVFNININIYISYTYIHYMYIVYNLALRVGMSSVTLEIVRAGSSQTSIHRLTLSTEPDIKDRH